MGNKNALTGIVMLETMWVTRKKDLIDLISPFVHYTVAKQTTPGDTIDINRVHKSVVEDFGYSDMPKSIITKVLNRTPALFSRHDGKYTFLRSIDLEVQQFEKRREECEQKISHVGSDLATYYGMHVRRKRKISSDEAIHILQSFFSRHGIYVGTDRLEEQELSPQEQELDYYTAQYIFEKRSQNANEFGYIIDLVKGYYLQSAIYLQAENGNLTTANYSNVTFYYDTPLLLRLLGWRTDEDQEAASELHELLKKRKGRFAYFPQTQREIGNVLYAYQNSMGRPSNITLEKLDEQGYTSSDVDRLRGTWETILSSRYSIELVNLPQYKQQSNGAVDKQPIIDESDLRKYLQNNMRWHRQEGLEADISSALAIHRLRDGLVSLELEKCGSVFVTTNNALAKNFNRYYQDKVEHNTFPLLISDVDLSAITWIKAGGKSNLPEKQLLRNAYMAMQPTSEMLEKFGQVLSRMEGEGKVTPEMIAVLKTNRFVKKEILFSTFDGGEGITENVISSAMRKITDDLTEEMQQETKKQAEDEKHKRLAYADEKARSESIQVRDKFIRILRGIALVIGLIVLTAAIWGTIKSWGTIALTVPFACFALFSVFSMIDTGRGREKIIDKLIVRSANRLQTRIYEKRKVKYREIAEYEDK